MLSSCSSNSNGTSNAAPTASSSSITTPEDTVVMGILSANDPDGNPIQFRIVSPPTKGVVVITNASNGNFSYTPNANTNSADSFTFKANDGQSDSNLAAVSVNITPVNDPPVANDDIYNVDEGGTLSVTTNPVLSNDSDVENDPLATSLVSNVAHGTLSFNLDGTFDYVHDGSETTTDSFTYLANDGALDSNIATVTITINPINDPPVAIADCRTTPQEQSLANALLNATDAETPTQLMFSINTNGTKGTATIVNPTTGEFTYTPLNPGDRGLDTFTFKVQDPSGGFDIGTISVVIHPKIMPLGDSITSGVTNGNLLLPAAADRVGYRKPLYDLLINGGFVDPKNPGNAAFDFVGSLQFGSNSLPNFDVDNEGHGGWRDDEIAWGRIGQASPNGIFEWLQANPADIVLLHIGTNGLTASALDVGDILDQIDAWETDVTIPSNHITVVLARIIDQDPIDPVVTQFNNNVATMAQARITAGDDIIIVDQHGVLSYPTDITDETPGPQPFLHPTSTGYSKMAPVWFNVLSTLIPKCP